MAYAGVPDMIAEYGEAEVVALAPLVPKAAPFYDEARINRALTSASAEIDSYLAVRFDVPLSVVPELIKTYTCDLARAALDRAGRAQPIEAAKRIRLWLKDLAAGRASLGSGPESNPDDVPEAESGGVQVAAPDRVFTEDSLAGYLR